MSKPFMKSGFLAVLITLVLLLIMYGLIKVNGPELSLKPTPKLPEITGIPPDTPPVTGSIKPTLEPVEEQPKAPENKMDPDTVVIESTIDDGPTILDPGEKRGPVVMPGEHIPIYKVTPVYPKTLASRGICGWVVVKFNISTSGATLNPEIVSSSHKGFESSALKAASKFKYKPSIEDNGQAVEVEGVTNKLIYKLDTCKNSVENKT